MRTRTDFPHETVREDVRVPLPDGVTLHARVWRPVSGPPVPALLEYAPDRLTDASAVRDGERHPWYAGHGYASVRVDVRGHGNSGGVPGDECGAGELADGVAVVEWLARQPWCTGRVGMFGVGPGGRCALQVAALAPGPLRAVVAVCASDDPYDGDGPYLGGAVTGRGLHGGGAARLAHAARPPDPRYTGEGWRETWLRRLAAVEPAGHTWLAHPRRDAYWQSAGVGDDTRAVRAAVLAVGALHDPARDSVLRLVERLPEGRVSGLVGPWPHGYPDRATGTDDGIGFLQETLRWWDRWLGDRDTDEAPWPPLRCRLGAAAPARGGWTTAGGPSPRVTEVPYALGGGPVRVASPPHTGIDAGAFRPAGSAGDLPPDQREEDARSVCFEFPVGEEPVTVLGRPGLTLNLRAPRPIGPVVARLCDVTPDGTSVLVTRGVLLPRGDEAGSAGEPAAGGAGTGGEPPAAGGTRGGEPPGAGGTRGGEPPGAEAGAGPGRVVEVALSLAAHVFAPGHRIRLAVSSAYWPWVWPEPGAGGFVLDPAGSRLALPVLGPGGGPADGPPPVPEPEHAAPPAVAVPQTFDAGRPRLLVTRDVAEGLWTLESTPHPGGTQVHPDGLEYTEEAHETYTIRDGDPLSARAHSVRTVRLHRPASGWDARVEATSTTVRDAEGFSTTDELVCRDGDEVVFHRTWEERFPSPAG
ncbi:CocE/NonD family hydrolase [Streptomyces sp. t39]|uniref:CocE/NonD family hydrolase n=1 Tax=Streptomyces sp. t39 TaxID=1828156 RepID=UPI0011CE6712|nr:CocE/NonD family hydrolase [Streptomyces sp. t39]TXS56378.1 CocE/NonD family hydrolase [Streptomyces sp. t39]